MQMIVGGFGKNNVRSNKTSETKPRKTSSEVDWVGVTTTMITIVIIMRKIQ